MPQSPRELVNRHAIVLSLENRVIEKSSLNINKMSWQRAHFERWALSPINCHKPSIEMLNDEGEIIIKPIYNIGFDPLKRNRTKDNFHQCQITFDRSYVVFWFAQYLRELLEVDSSLLGEIGQACGVEQSEPVAENMTEKSLRAIAKELGFRVVKLQEPKQQPK